MQPEANRVEQAFAYETKQQIRETQEDFDASSDEDITGYTAAKETYAVLIAANLGRSPEQIAKLAWQCARATARAMRDVSVQ